MDSTRTADMASRAPDLSMVVGGAILVCSSRGMGGECQFGWELRGCCGTTAIWGAQEPHAC
jgi:hypothetical protein